MLFHCGPQQDKVERIIEDGAEVVINHLEPYQQGDEPNNLSLEKEFTIDLEKDDIANIGLSDSLAGVDVDSLGNIFLFQYPSGDRNIVFKFDSAGKFLTSFGLRGQGPGELNFTWFIRVSDQDKVVMTGPAEKKLFIFNNDGKFENYISFDSEVLEALPLENGNFLIKKENMIPESKEVEWPLFLCNARLEQIKQLDRYYRIDEFMAETIEFPEPVLISSVSNNKIFIGYGKRGYEIWVFDLNGNLIRKIRKDYKPVDIPDEVKEENIKATKDPQFIIYGKKIRFSKHWPPFQYLFTDDEGRLFVMTYEEGESPGEFMYDVFNPDGIFIERMSLGNLVFEHRWNIQYVTAKKNRLYCLRRKESGFRELIVYRMIWQ
jgi:hypothetical protein